MAEHDEPRQLTPEMEEKIDGMITDGVFLRRCGPGIRGDLTTIVWRPGAPNKLADVILTHCTHPLTLELDGHDFTISPEPLTPRRGDEVEAWLKRMRDQQPAKTRDWYVLDDLLDSYRLHADVGASLSEEISSE